MSAISSCTNLRKHIRIFSGSAPSILDLKARGPLPYVKVDDLNIGSKYQRESRQYVDDAPIVVPKGSILFPKRGAAIFNNKMKIASTDLCLDTNVMGVQTLDGLDAEYFYYAIYHEKLFRIADTSTIPQLNNKHLYRCALWMPDVSVQRKIASSLAAIDKISDALTELVEWKNRCLNGLAQHLLTGKKRFPAFRGTPWSQVRVGDVFRERIETDRADLTLLSVTSGRGIIPRDELDKRDTSNPDKGKYKRVAVGDIAYNTMRMWQGVSALSPLEGIVSPAYTVAVPTPKIDGGFAKHLFKFPPVVHVFHRYSQGLVDDTLSLKYKRFAKIRLRIPASVEEQKKIAKVLDLCGVELALLEEQRRQYELYKRGLMQRLLSGEIQVPA